MVPDVVTRASTSPDAVPAGLPRPTDQFAQILDVVTTTSQPSDVSATAGAGASGGCMCDALAAASSGTTDAPSSAPRLRTGPAGSDAALVGMVPRWLADDPVARADTRASTTTPSLDELRSDPASWDRFTGWVHHVGAPHRAPDPGHVAAVEAGERWAASVRALQGATAAASGSLRLRGHVGPT
jgi:hypothetical protein